MPRARGEAEIKTKSRGPAQVEVELKGLGQPYLLGPEYLTYVLWAVSPQGQSKNLGELRIDGEETKVECSVEMQSFGLFVTAEPYYAVLLPSDVVVVENVMQEDTKGKATSVEVQYELMPRGAYAAAGAPGSTGPGGNPKDPLDLRQARNAVKIAELVGADRYASDTFVKAAQQLQQAELVAERARVEREAAERAKLEAEQARVRAEADRAALRSRLLAQFNEILETRDTARGLIVNIGDVLFDSGRSTLRPEAREKLARFAGIVLNYPGLSIVCEGHADSTGTAFYNQALSEDRASSVGEYLEMQGVPMDRISSRGFGEEEPIESNATSAGRRMNRRVEMVVSGDVIGVPLTTGRGR